MADPRFDIRMSAYERNAQAKAQRQALQNMRNFHYRDRGLVNTYPSPKPRTNPIGIPLIRQRGSDYG